MARHSNRLPSSSVAAAWTLELMPKFWPDIWTAIAPHIGELDDSARERLAEIIKRYVQEAQFEENAPKISDAEDRLTKLRSAAAAFCKVLDSPMGDAGRDAESRLESVLKQTPRFLIRSACIGDIEPEVVPNSQLSLPEEPPPCSHLSLQLYSELLTEFMVGCDRAKRDLGALHEGRQNYPPGGAWNEFVSQLADFYQTPVREPTASKAAVSKRGSKPKPSPFVRFVHAVQSQLPKRFWRHPPATDKTVKCHLGAVLSEAVSKPKEGVSCPKIGYRRARG
jgi:hypothetical protein